MAREGFKTWFRKTYPHRVAGGDTVSFTMYAELEYRLTFADAIVDAVRDHTSHEKWPHILETIDDYEASKQ